MYCRYSFISAVVFLTAFGCVNLPAQDELDILANSIELAYDDDQKKPLLTLERRGGLRVAPPAGFQPEPLFSLYANGTLVRGIDRPGGAEFRGRLSQRQIVELLDFVVNKNQFYKTDTQSIKKDLERREPRVMIADALSTRLSANLKRGSHVVEAYALEFTQGQHPDIEQLGFLLAIEKRLQHHAAIVEIGDETKIKTILQEMNRELKKKSPNLPPLLPKDIVYARRLPGELTVNATKNIFDMKTKKPQTKIVGSYRNKGPDSKPTVGIYIMEDK